MTIIVIATIIAATIVFTSFAYYAHKTETHQPDPGTREGDIKFVSEIDAASKQLIIEYIDKCTETMFGSPDVDDLERISDKAKELYTTTTAYQYKSGSWVKVTSER